MKKAPKPTYAAPKKAKKKVRKPTAARPYKHYEG